MNITGCVIQSPDYDLAERRFASGHGQMKSKNKSRAEDELRSAHGRAVKKSKKKKKQQTNGMQNMNRPRSMAVRLNKIINCMVNNNKNKPSAEQEPGVLGPSPRG